jgi:hypothetical protein
MHPHPEGQSDFKYPLGGLLQVNGVVKEAELRSPKRLDANGEECLLVVKNGKTTGVTIGRVAGIESVIPDSSASTASMASRRRLWRLPYTPTATKMAHSPPPVTLVPSSSTGRDASSDCSQAVPARRCPLTWPTLRRISGSRSASRRSSPAASST